MKQSKFAQSAAGLVLAAMLAAGNIAYGAPQEPLPIPEFIASDDEVDQAEPLRDEDLGALAPAAGGTTAADTEQAKQFVLALGNGAISALTGPGLTQSQRQTQLRHLLVESFDLDMISRLVLGRYWRVATEPERAEYRRVFEAFILNAYVSRLSNYSGEALVVHGAMPSKRGVIVVRSQIESPKKPPMRIDWLVRATDGRYQVIDVAVEGISMAITQRSEFASIIKSNGGRVAGLIDALRQKST